MKTIPITQGEITFVDDADYDWLMQWKWSVTSTRHVKRGAELNGKYKTIYIHRELLRIGNPYEVDHIDGSGLNNQRANLRIATSRQNSMNQRLSKVSTTGLKGVTWDKARKLWMAHITINKRFLNLGRFKTSTEAAHCYDVVAVKEFGDFARTNISLGLL